ncbi:MAG: SynChlorMet cassette radical SAM/SPASM protein ScmE [Deltaproteobacteria bacterium]|nr:SynChlorMet cassette radical SAM/SPASM protein ScmE [Deltaproteobacteria bacterium]
MRVMRTPRSADLLITTRCNLRCKYCSHMTSAGDVDKDLPTDEWLRFFDELGRLAVMDVCLQGGEPFIREDLKELIHGIVRNRMRFSILSNGTLVTDEMAEFLASTRRCDAVQISIDGSDPVSHDVFRGQGTFLRAVEGLKTLHRHDVTSTVRVTIHRRNVTELDKIARLLLDDFGLPSFSTNAASYLGLCRKNRELVQLTTVERGLAMESLVQLSEKYEGRIGATAGPLAEVQLWTVMEQARLQSDYKVSDSGHLTGCNGPMTKMAVRADGAMLVCGQLPGIVLGRINEDPLDRVWQRHPVLTTFRERHDIPLSSFDFCRDCGYIKFCTGGCPALAFTTMGDPHHPSPDSCFRLFLEDGGALPPLMPECDQAGCRSGTPSAARGVPRN